MNVNQWKENGTASVQVADMIRNLTVQCKSPLFDAQTQFARSRANGATFANIFLAGKVAIVDMNSCTKTSCISRLWTFHPDYFLR